MPIARLNGIDLYYEVTGTGPPIVFLHGVGGNHMSWFQQVPYFARLFTSVAFDQRGWGRSIEAADGPGGSAFVEDLRGLLDYLSLEQVNLVAQSMGGWTALGLAYRYPERVRSLVLASSHAGIETPEIRASIRLGSPVEELPELPFRPSRALDTRFAQNNPSLAFLYNQIGELNPPRDFPMQNHLGRINTLSSEQAAGIHCPALFVVGEDDRVIPPAAIELAYRLLPNGRIARVPATGHSVYFEQPGLFNSMVENFLSSLDG